MKLSLAACALLGLTITACGTTVPTDRVEMDPLILQGDATGKVAVLDPRTLFKQATADYQQERYEKALKSFRTIARTFPDSKYTPHAHFNAGLALVRLERWAEGKKAFIAAARGMAGTKDEWDARFQLTLCLEKLKQWRELKAEARTVSRRKGLHVTQAAESYARLGIAHYELEELAEAERAFEVVIERHRHNMAVPSMQSSPYIARAQYLIGEIYRGLFATIKFRLPVETMKRDLQDKSSFFLKGQSAYLRALRLQNEYWSVAAGYKLGRLYEDFYRDMMKAEIPDELDADDREVYYGELKKYIQPLVVRAIEIYERNLGMSDRMGGKTEWAKKTQASLDRMRDILRRDFADSRRRGGEPGAK